MARTIETVRGGVQLFMETAAQLSLGQTIFYFVDRFLWVVEKSTQWSLPTHEIAAEENGNTFGNIELVRPLPWIAFLPLLLVIRLFRTGLNVGLSILGYSRVEPAAMVKGLQKLRIRLSDIKSNAMERIRQRNSNERDNNTNVTDSITEHTSAVRKMMELRTWNNKLIQLLAQMTKFIKISRSSLPCQNVGKRSPSPPSTRIKVVKNHSTVICEEQSAPETETNKQPECNNSEPSSEDQQSSEDSDTETVQAKIDRYAAVDDSTDDEEFNPAVASGSSDDSSSTSDDRVSDTELQDITNQAQSFAYSEPKLGESKITYAGTTVDSGDLLKNPACTKSETGLISNWAFSEVTADPKTETTPNDHTSVVQSTGGDETIGNSKTNNATEDSEDFYSPCKIVDESEPVFYSPISSTSPSPDHMISQVTQEQGSGPVEQRPTLSARQNGDPISKTPIYASAHPTPNGQSNAKGNAPPNIPTKTGNSHNRGRRRNSHLSNKRK